MASQKTIATLDLDHIDRLVLDQAFDGHPDRITIIHTDSIDDISTPPSLIISRHNIEDSETPLYRLNDDTLRIGTIVDEIERQLLKSDRHGIITYKNYHLNFDTQTLASDERTIPLTDRETDILALLIRQGDAGCTRPYLLENVWGYRSDLETHTVETHMYRLRQKIEKDPSDPQHLKTTDDGYQLI